jgi:thiamine-monophosphate kinase
VGAPLGEFELIAAIRERIERAGAPESVAGLVLGSGDDAAVSVREGASVISVDALIEGVHFRIPPFEPRSVGHKALAVALSDLAAMGAAPREAYVQLGVRDGLGEHELLALADGVGTLAAAHRVAVAGGDVTRAPALLLAVTAVGQAAEPEALVRRRGARAGDVLAVTGELGGAAAGLMALERPELAAALAEPVAAALRKRQLEPEPRLAAGLALAGAGATAMIDLSDGLGGDARHLAAASGAALRIEGERLPVQDGVAAVAEAAGADAIDLAAGGGEDYELLATLPPDRVDEASAAVAACGLKLTVVGSVEPGSGVELSGPGGAARPISGFDQLRPRPAPPDRS